MGEYIVKLTEVEEKALLTDMVSIQEWLDNVIHNKARQCINRIATSQISFEEKLNIVKEAKVEPASRRETEVG